MEFFEQIDALKVITDKEVRTGKWMSDEEAVKEVKRLVNNHNRPKDVVGKQLKLF